MNNIKSILVRLDDDLHKKLKIKVIEDNTSIQKLIEEFIIDYVESSENEKE